MYCDEYITRLFDIFIHFVVVKTGRILPSYGMSASALWRCKIKCRVGMFYSKEIVAFLKIWLQFLIVRRLYYHLHFLPAAMSF